MKISKKRKAIITEAVEWLGTKWQHQACVKNVAADCAMFVAGVGKNTDLIDEELLGTIPNYPKDWHFHNEKPILPGVMETLGCKKKPNTKMRPGDILVFKIGNCASHVGILLEDDIFIHSYNGGKREIVKNTLHGSTWEERLLSVYTFPGVK